MRAAANEEGAKLAVHEEGAKPHFYALTLHIFKHSKKSSLSLTSVFFLLPLPNNNFSTRESVAGPIARITISTHWRGGSHHRSHGCQQEQ